MQRTADFHHHVANSGFPHSDRLFEHTAAFDAAVDMLDAYAPPSKLPIPRFLCPRQLGSCTACVRLIPGVLSKPICVRNMSLSAGLNWGGYGFPHLRMLVC
jgi:hypothetical protein